MNVTASTRACILAVAVLCAGVLPASATVTVCPLFSNNMVIQRNKSVPVYGTASPGENVTVTFNGQSPSVAADAQGDWRVNLTPMSANATSQTMTIAGANNITITGVLVGDVWLISGQSNMTMPLSASNRTQDETSANFPGIRRFYRGGAAVSSSVYPTKDLTGSSWIVCSPGTAGSFPGTAFYYARKIYQDQGGAIPIGLLECARGSTNIDVWVCPESIAGIPLLQPLLSPSGASDPPFSYFNSMVYPMEPFAICGVIWWQGCTRELTSQSVDSYYAKERAIVQGWRQLWGGAEFPFYIVQLANYEAPAVGPTPDLVSTHRNDTRVQQANILGLPRTGMAVAIDVGDATNIHPPDKLDIGERLALWALKNDYGRTTLVESGPILKDVTVAGSTLVCSFDYVGAGLIVGSKTPYQPTQEIVGGTLARFSIAGSNGTWYDGNAVISGSTVVVSSPSVATPNKVAYAYWPNPTGCNLYNKDGLPASPFYVDDVTAKYTVTASAGSGGTISPTGAKTYLKRKTALYTITPNANYYISGVTVDGVSVGSVPHYTFDPIYANHTIAATFATTAPTYTITASATAGGSLSQSGTIVVAQGGSQAFKVIPNAGCYVDTVTVDGVSVGNRGSFTFADARANHTLTASFKCKITATIGYGGAIAPAGITDVPYGTNKAFTITPNPGFTTTNVSVDGVNQGAITTYTFTNVTGPHTISATFSGGGGTQDGVPRIYDLLFSVNTDSLPASGNTGNWATYIPSGKTFTAARGTPSVEIIGGVKWEKNVNSEYDGYRMGPYATPIVNIGASVVMAIRPTLDAGITDYLNGACIFNDRLTLGFKGNTGQVFVTRNGTTNTSTATLTSGQVAILSLVAQPDGKYKVWANGTLIMDITTTSNITALTPYGNSVYVTLGDSDTTGAHTFNGNIGDTFCYLVPLSDADRQQLEASLTAKFAGGGPTYTITASAGSGGSISPSGTVTINQGASKTFTITPNAGYVVSDVLVDGASVGSVGSYVFSNVAANHTIAAAFSSGGVPRSDQLIGSWTTDSLPASGTISTWASYMPAGQTLTKMGSPTVDIINGVKWANHHKSSSDGMDLGLFASTYSIPCSGASIVMAVKPARDGVHTDWVSCFSVFTYTLSFGIRNDTGNICARRNSTLFNYTSAVIPDGQITILSAIVQPDGTFKVYANGTQVVSETATSAFTQMAPTWSTSDSGRHITMGRAYPATWSCFNGDIGDTYFYKVALTDTERQQLEALLTGRFIPPAYQDVASIAALKAKADGAPVRLTAAQTVIYAPRNAGGTRTTAFFYTGEARALGGLKVVDKTSDTLTTGNRITNLTGYVRKPVGAEPYLELTVDPTGSGNAPILPVALGCRSVLSDPNVPTNTVVTWGKVKSINGSTSFTISDGYSGDVTVMINGIALPAGFDTTSYVVVTGVVSADRTVQAQTIRTGP